MLPNYPWLNQSQCFDDCIYESGWKALINDLLLEVGKVMPPGVVRLELRQVKEKLGELRFYFRFPVDGLSDAEKEAISALVVESRVRSSLTCIDCGEPGQMRFDQGWIAPWCDRHAAGSREEWWYVERKRSPADRLDRFVGQPGDVTITRHSNDDLRDWIYEMRILVTRKFR